MATNRATHSTAPSASSFDLSDKESMGDPEFVEGRARVMLDEARALLFEGADPKAGVDKLVDKWAKEFSPLNPEYVQTLSLDSLNLFLKARGIGTDDADPAGPVKALVATTLDRFADVSIKYHEGQIIDSQLAFEIDACVEDFAALIRGLDNAAD